MNITKLAEKELSNLEKRRSPGIIEVALSRKQGQHCRKIRPSQKLLTEMWAY
jgi:hypothetical protein